MKVVHVFKDKFSVYGGRETSYNRCKHNHVGTEGKDGYFGNPIAFGQKCQICGQTHEDNEAGRKALLACYKRYFWNRVNTDVEFREHIVARKDDTWGCWCDPKPCHLFVIRDWLEAGCPLKS